MRHHVSRWHAHPREGGAAAVEFGLVLLPLMTLLLGLIQYGWYFYVSQTASAAAREGARQVIVGNCWADLTSFVQDQAPMASSALASPAPSTLDVGEMVTVTVTVPEDSADIIGFVPVPSGELTKSFSARMEDTEAVSCP